MKGRTFSDDHRRNLSACQKGVKRGPLPENTKQKMSVSHKGKIFTKETRDRLSKAVADKTIYTLYHKDGSTFTGTRTEFYSQFDLSMGNVSSVLSGTRKSVGGWSITSPN